MFGEKRPKPTDTQLEKMRQERVASMAFAIMQASQKCPEGQPRTIELVGLERSPEAEDYLRAVGELLLGQGAKTIIGETCDKISSIGNAENPHIVVCFLGQPHDVKLSAGSLWNSIYSPPDIETKTQTFSRLDNIPGLEPYSGSTVVTTETFTSVALSEIVKRIALGL